ncbi:MAG: DNA starvation/stationary phase protection protein [Mangrovicoccus sp.]|nr:DNA starvation/stationary phase protection protein [Mangrovicoccus sp.]
MSKSKTLNVVPEAETVETGITDVAALAEALAGVLADTYRLVFKTHAYHWNVEGPLFHSVHKLTEAQYAEMFAAADELAERIRALGALAPFQMAGILKASVIGDRAELPATVEMCADLAEDHTRVARRLHDLVRLADASEDPVTADLATVRSGFHEKAAWMLRAIAKQ